MPRLSLVFFRIVPTCQRALMLISINQAIAAFPDGISYNCEDHYGKPAALSVWEYIKANWINFFVFVSILSSSTKALWMVRTGSLITFRTWSVAAFGF